MVVTTAVHVTAGFQDVSVNGPVLSMDGIGGGLGVLVVLPGLWSLGRSRLAARRTSRRKDALRGMWRFIRLGSGLTGHKRGVPDAGRDG